MSIAPAKHSFCPRYWLYRIMQLLCIDGFHKLCLPLSRYKLWDTVQDLFHLLSGLSDSSNNSWLRYSHYAWVESIYSYHWAGTLEWLFTIMGRLGRKSCHTVRMISTKAMNHLCISMPRNFSISIGTFYYCS